MNCMLARLHASTPAGRASVRGVSIFSHTRNYVNGRQSSQLFRSKLSSGASSVRQQSTCTRSWQLPVRYNIRFSSNSGGSKGGWQWSYAKYPAVFGLIALSTSLYPAIHCEALPRPVYQPVPSQYLFRLYGIEHPKAALVATDPSQLAHLDTGTSGGSLWRHLLRLLAPDLPLLLAVAVSALAAAVAGLLAPRVTGELVNVIAAQLSGPAGAASLSMSLRVLQGPALRLLRLFVLQGLCTWCHIGLVGWLGERVAWRLRRQAYARVLAQDMVWFDAQRAGEVTARVMQDVAEFKHAFKQCVTQGLKSVAASTGGIAHLFQLNAPLTVTLAGSLPAIYLLLNAYGAYLRRLSAQARRIETEATAVAGEVLGNVRTVRSFAAEPTEVARFAAVGDRAAAASTKLAFHIGLFQGLTNVSIGSMILMVLYYGGTLVVRGEMTGGDLMTYLLSVQNTQKSLVSLGALAGISIKATGAAARCFECLDLQSTIPISGGNTLERHLIRGAIEFRNVHFTYPTRPHHPVLTGLNLRIPPGKTVALCGLSGGGKSTVAALLERFYDPDAGEVCLDGHDIRSLDPRWLRGHIGYIHQEPTLFAGTIADNIRYGRPNATDAEVEAVAIRAHADTFIRRFPQGYDTRVGERGVTLSGGQKQRIAIARALLKDPEILILDEATSALDAQSEQVVQAALTEVMRNRTVLVIAHRLSTIEHADHIVVMGNKPGNILEQGTHAQLLQRPDGVYAGLYGHRSQQL